MKNNNKNNWYIKLFSLLKLETATRHGRVNLAGVIVVAGFCLLYSASDMLRHLISSTEDVIKTIALRKDIYHESASVSEAVIPIVVVFVFCLIFLGWHEHRKNK